MAIIEWYLIADLLAVRKRERERGSEKVFFTLPTFVDTNEDTSR